MAITGQVRRRRIIINADAYISSATSNVPVLIKFNSTDHPDVFATGDTKNSVWFSTDAGGNNTLYHEGVAWDSTNAIFYVKVDLSSTADTVIYFWYGTPAITGTENKEGVWYNGVAIWHFEGNANDTFGDYNGTANNVDRSTSYGIVNEGYYFNSTSDSITHNTVSTSAPFTIMHWGKITSYDATYGHVAWGYSSGTNFGTWIMASSGTTITTFSYRPSGSAYTSSNPSSNGNTATITDWNLFSYVQTNGTTVTQQINGNTEYNPTIIGGSLGALQFNRIGLYYTTDYNWVGYIDEFWVFSDAKTQNFKNAVYNNVANYSSFITIDGAVTVGSPPKQVYPVWSSNQNLSETISYSSYGSFSVSTVLTDIEQISFVGYGGFSIPSTILYVSEISFGSKGELSSYIEDIVLISYTGYATFNVEDLDVDVETITFTCYGSFEYSETSNFENVSLTGYASFSPPIITGTGSSPVFWKIEIVHGATTFNLNELGIIENAKLSDRLGKNADEFEIALYNDDGEWSGIFAVGDHVYFYTGPEENPTTKKFHGIITEIDFELPFPHKNTMVLQGVDYGSLRLSQTSIVGVHEYTNRNATSIIQELLDTYCPDITYTNLENFTDTIPNIKFSWEYVSDALEDIAKLVGADFYVDQNDDLHFYDNSSLSSTYTITSEEVMNALIKKDSYKHYDRVYVIGGKEKYLDVNNTTATVAVDTYSKYYASSFTLSKTNLLYIEAYLKKTGVVSEDVSFEIVEDSSGPTGDVVAWGKFSATSIGTDAGWVTSTLIDAQLSTKKTYWLVFKKVGIDSSNTYQIYHDNTTSNGHKDSTDGLSWTNKTGKLAFKTYYGVQIIQQATGQKIVGNFHTDLVIAEPTIVDFDTAKLLADQKIIEYSLRNTSSIRMRPPLSDIRSGSIISLELTGVPSLENQTVMSIEWEFNEPRVESILLKTTSTGDFYRTFAKLFADLRKLKIHSMHQASNLSNDYISKSETVAVSESINILDVSTSTIPRYDDGTSKWGCIKWQ